jgi:hypothetical protein
MKREAMMAGERNPQSGWFENASRYHLLSEQHWLSHIWTPPAVPRLDKAKKPRFSMARN